MFKTKKYKESMIAHRKLNNVDCFITKDIYFFYHARDETGQNNVANILKFSFIFFLKFQ